MTSDSFPPVGLCRLDELQDPCGKGFSVVAGGEVVDILVVRRGNRVYGYLNSCPHTGGPLDWVPDQFLDLNHQYIQCATHAALFRIMDGVCVYGPCSGAYLVPVSVQLVNGAVIFPTTDGGPDTT